MIFMRIEGDEQVDADRAALSSFLEARGLRIAAGPYGGSIVDRRADPLAFDGRISDLHLDPLDHDGPLSGGISHASLTDAECSFVYDLCCAAGFMIFNPQGDPASLVPGGTHAPRALSSLDGVVHVGSAGELSRALAAGFDAFARYRDRVLRTVLGPTGAVDPARTGGGAPDPGSAPAARSAVEERPPLRR